MVDKLPLLLEITLPHTLGRHVAWDPVSNLVAVSVLPSVAGGDAQVVVLDPQSPEDYCVLHVPAGGAADQASELAAGGDAEAPDANEDGIAQLQWSPRHEDRALLTVMTSGQVLVWTQAPPGGGAASLQPRVINRWHGHAPFEKLPHRELAFVGWLAASSPMRWPGRPDAPGGLEHRFCQEEPWEQKLSWMRAGSLLMVSVTKDGKLMVSRRGLANGGPASSRWRHSVPLQLPLPKGGPLTSVGVAAASARSLRVVLSTQSVCSLRSVDGDLSVPTTAGTAPNAAIDFVLNVDAVPGQAMWQTVLNPADQGSTMRCLMHDANATGMLQCIQYYQESRAKPTDWKVGSVFTRPHASTCPSSCSMHMTNDGSRCVLLMKQDGGNGQLQALVLDAHAKPPPEAGSNGPTTALAEGGLPQGCTGGAALSPNGHLLAVTQRRGDGSHALAILALDPLVIGTMGSGPSVPSAAQVAAVTAAADAYAHRLLWTVLTDVNPWDVVACCHALMRAQLAAERSSSSSSGRSNGAVGGPPAKPADGAAAPANGEAGAHDAAAAAAGGASGAGGSGRDGSSSGGSGKPGLDPLRPGSAGPFMARVVDAVDEALQLHPYQQRTIYGVRWTHTKYRLLLPAPGYAWHLVRCDLAARMLVDCLEVNVSATILRDDVIRRLHKVPDALHIEADRLEQMQLLPWRDWLLDIHRLLFRVCKTWVLRRSAAAAATLAGSAAAADAAVAAPPAEAAAAAAAAAAGGAAVANGTAPGAVAGGADPAAPGGAAGAGAAAGAAAQDRPPEAGAAAAAGEQALLEADALPLIRLIPDMSFLRSLCQGLGCYMVLLRALGSAAKADGGPSSQAEAQLYAQQAQAAESMLKANKLLLNAAVNSGMGKTPTTGSGKPLIEALPDGPHVARQARASFQGAKLQYYRCSGAIKASHLQTILPVIEELLQDVPEVSDDELSASLSKLGLIPPSGGPPPSFLQQLVGRPGPNKRPMPAPPLDMPAGAGLPEGRMAVAKRRRWAAERDAAFGVLPDSAKWDGRPDAVDCAPLCWRPGAPPLQVSVDGLSASAALAPPCRYPPGSFGGTLCSTWMEVSPFGGLWKLPSA